MFTFNKRFQKCIFLALTIMAASFVVRAINLNYNSPFNDEAIYIVIGKLGIFHGDWSSYNAASWMAGLPFLYPPLAALAYILGGIVGARLLNVIFGILTVGVIFAITFLISDLKEKEKLAGALIASAIVGGSGVGYYVSRLATYDAPSFFFLFLSILLLLLAERWEDPAKWYFLSALSLLIGLGTKIMVGSFIPPIVIFSHFSSKKRGTRMSHFWKSYFLIPLFLSLFLYLAFNFSRLISYYQTQNLPRVPFAEVIHVFWEGSNLVWIFWLVGSLGLLAKKQISQWTILSLAALWVLFFHLFIGHPLSLDKHTFLSVAFLSITSGLGIANMLPALSSQRKWQFLIRGVVCAIILFWLFSYQDAQKYNVQWRNTDTVLAYLATEVKSGERILSEIGTTTILAVYEKDSPFNITTFDWLEYNSFSGPRAYSTAVRDGYFNYIVLESQDVPKLDNNERLHEIVMENTEDIYTISYSRDEFLVLKRNF